MKNYILIIFIFIYTLTYSQCMCPISASRSQVMPSSYTNADFYIFAGQSNCGRSVSSNIPSDSSKYSGLQTGCYMYNQNTGYVWQQLNVGGNTELINWNNLNEFGAEAVFMHVLQSTTGTPKYLIKYGVGSTTLATDWLGATYNNFRGQLENAIYYGLVNGVKMNLKGFVWMQGEQDATNLAQANAYQANLGIFFTQFESDYNHFISEYGLTILSYKKIIAQINGSSDVSETYYSTVRTAESNYCSVPANNATLIITSSYPLQDAVHYSALGNLMFGWDVFKAVK